MRYLDQDLQLQQVMSQELLYETAATLRTGGNDHSSYQVDRMPIDFHEYICVDT